jgi:hypothetical protein
MAPFAAVVPKAYADPDGALTHNSFAAVERYGIVADWIGPDGKDDSAETEFRTIQLDVRGHVARPYLYWAGYDSSSDPSTLDSVSVAVDSYPTPDKAIAYDTYEPDEWQAVIITSFLLVMLPRWLKVGAIAIPFMVPGSLLLLDSQSR